MAVSPTPTTRRRLVAAATVTLVGALLLTPVAPAPATAGVVRDEAPARSLSFMTGVAGVTLDAAAQTYYVATRDDSVIIADQLNGAALRPSLQGPATGLDGPRSPALGPVGELVVPNFGGGTVTVYAPGAAGDTAPDRVLVNGLSAPAGVAVDADGFVYTANYGNDTVTVHDPEAGPNTAPVRTLQGPSTGLAQPTGVALGPDGSLYVANFPGSVTVYAPGASGDATPTRTFSAETIGGAEAVALDSSGNTYVAVLSGAVEVFGPAASGEAQPVVSLRGPDTGLQSSLGVVVEPDRAVSVANDLPGTVTTHAPLVPFAAPSRVRGLRVGGAPDARRRTVGWKAPSDDGGLPVEAYQVVVRKGASTVLKRTVTDTDVVLRRADLPRGDLTVRVLARNAAGRGPAMAEGFTVRR